MPAKITARSVSSPSDLVHDGAPGIRAANLKAWLEDSTISDIEPSDFSAQNVDGAGSTPSLRTLGTGANQACAGNDARLSDVRPANGLFHGGKTVPVAKTAKAVGRPLYYDGTQFICPSVSYSPSNAPLREHVPKRIISAPGNLTIGKSNSGDMVLVSPSGGTRVITLPSASSAGNGFGVAMKQIGDGKVVVRPTGSDKLNGRTQMLMRAGFANMMLVSNGANDWSVVSGLLGTVHILQYREWKTSVSQGISSDQELAITAPGAYVTPVLSTSNFLCIFQGSFGLPVSKRQVLDYDYLISANAFDLRLYKDTTVIATFPVSGVITGAEWSAGDGDYEGGKLTITDMAIFDSVSLEQFQLRLVPVHDPPSSPPCLGTLNPNGETSGLYLFEFYVE